MTRFASFALIGAAAIGLSLSTPEVARAQSFGLHVDIGRSHFDYSRGYDYGRYRSSYYDYRHSHRHHGYRYNDYYSPYRRPVVIPDYYHWTPDRGYHSHGTIVIPHRGHYHVRPY
jgi:hypothetical protein